MKIVRNLALQILALTAVAASVAARAEDFRIQARLAYDQIDFNNVAQDADVISASGTFFFEPVPTDHVPVGEAAYIARSSYVDLMASTVEIGGEDADAIAANLGYHFADTIFFARAGVVQTDISGDDDTSWNGTLGIVPIPRLFFGTDFTEDEWDPNLTARYVGKFSNGHWYGASITLADPDEDDTEIGLDFDYYFDRFKLGWSLNSGTNLVSARAEVGLPHGFALLGRVYTNDGSDGFGLQLTWRDL